MLCLRCRAMPSALRTYSSPMSMSRYLTPKTTTTTPFSTLSSPLRPMTNFTTTVRPQLPTLSSAQLLPSAATQQSRSFSASASLAGKRATYNPSRRVQKRRHGFLARVRSRGGRLILLRRRAKGRKSLSW
ncbi:ribosomal protein L34-domain-containing protein [Aspergillus bertholletiae]|uniref:Large ribosomal subunit protein bL34m n=1 Tax=Aspergillus bertholletiae TaxID=1226010 RepID=A0A5N7AUF3_9EURO|nr:ribosomal protein L34-domain-containing protein [Aspergillus bertholletiae]